jgi:hypothetical protein
MIGTSKMEIYLKAADRGQATDAIGVPVSKREKKLEAAPERYQVFSNSERVLLPEVCRERQRQR